MTAYHDRRLAGHYDPKPPKDTAAKTEAAATKRATTSTTSDKLTGLKTKPK